jgi:zinc protease
MTLVVVGDVDPAIVRTAAARLFRSDHPAATRPARPAPPVRDGERRGPVEVYETSPVTQAHIAVGFAGVAVTDPDRHTLDLIAVLLAGQSGRLFHELRERQGLAYAVNAFSQEGLDPGYFAIYAAVRADARDQALAEMRAQLERLAAEPIPDEELARAKRSLVGNRALALETRAAQATAYALAEAYGLGWDAPLRSADVVAAVDAAAVQRVARELLRWDQAVIVVVMPRELSPGAAERTKGKKMKAPPPPKPPKPLKPGKATPAAGAPRERERRRGADPRRRPGVPGRPGPRRPAR